MSNQNEKDLYEMADITHLIADKQVLEFTYYMTKEEANEFLKSFHTTTPIFGGKENVKEQTL